MVKKQEFINMLIDAISMEEISVTSRLEVFLKKLELSRVDEAAKAEARAKIGRILDETHKHARTLTEILKKVVGDDRSEY